MQLIRMLNKGYFFIFRRGVSKFGGVLLVVWKHTKYELIIFKIMHDRQNTLETYSMNSTVICFFRIKFSKVFISNVFQ